MNRQTLGIAVALALGIAALASSIDAAPKTDPARRSCFSLHLLEGTRADGDKTIYARVGLNDIYRLDLAFRCTSLANQNGLVLTPAGGRDNICGPLDLDVRARGPGNEGIGGGGSEPCVIKSITKLTPTEAAALPRKVRP